MGNIVAKSVVLNNISNLFFLTIVFIGPRTHVVTAALALAISQCQI